MVKSFTKLKCHIIHTVAFWSVSECQPRAMKEICLSEETHISSVVDLNVKILVLILNA